MSKNLTSLGYCHPELADKLEILQRSLEEAGIEYERIETFRSGKRQMELYAQGRTKPGDIVTNANVAQSAHCLAIMRVPVAAAADYVVKIGGKPCGSASVADFEMWQCFGELARRAGLVWGGDWKTIKDYRHVELKNWKAIK
jgi:peptidoglycan L-alanyl-D-glutamate endopeptidase CwlK